MYDIGSRKQLFIDERFLRDVENVALVVNPPTGQEIVLESERPWEAYRVFFSSILDTGDGYRMYYTDMAFDEGGRATTHLCLVFSGDGRRWERPELGLFEFQGSRKNNIVAPYVHGAPIYDPTWPFERPYLMVGTISGLFDPDGLKPPDEGDRARRLTLRDPNFGARPNNPHLFASADGVHWDVAVGPLCDFACDNWTNQILYDHRLRKFVAYLRAFPGRRTVARYETDDPTRVPWGVIRPDAEPNGYGGIYITNELPTVMDVDEEDCWRGDVQNPAVVVYPWAEDVYLAFPSLHRYYPGCEAGPEHRFRFFNDGVDDVHLYISRDGVAWERPSRWPYLGLGIWGDYDGGSLFTGLGFIRSGNELWQYYTACRRTHGGIVPSEGNVARICRTRQRLDGFVSADADHRGGQFCTPLLRFQGERLVLNINCGGMGEAWVEILDEEGRPVPGFEMDRCDPIDRNFVAYPVTWGNDPDVSALQGKRVRLRFRMRLAKLYAFQFIGAEEVTQERRPVNA
jgi:hypothetical protein